MGAHPWHSQAMSQQEMMSRVDGRLAIAQAGRVYADSITQISATPWLVERNPVRDAVTQAPSHKLAIVGKGVGRSAVKPAARQLQRRRKIPVIERREGLNIFRQQHIHQAIVEIHAILIHCSTTLR